MCSGGCVVAAVKCGSGSTCWAGPAVVGAHGVEALHRRVGGAGLVGEVALVHVCCAGGGTWRRRPPSITDTLIFGLRRNTEIEYKCEIIRDYRLTLHSHLRTCSILSVSASLTVGLSFQIPNLHI